MGRIEYLLLLIYGSLMLGMGISFILVKFLYGDTKLFLPGMLIAIVALLFLVAVKMTEQEESRPNTPTPKNDKKQPTKQECE